MKELFKKILARFFQKKRSKNTQEKKIGDISGSLKMQKERYKKFYKSED